jgi:ATP-dependent Clp protease ATP-binding subunit ClpA
MFDKFSSRSRVVVFVARFAAGERGSNAIDVEDLLVGLVSEDQGTHGSMLSKVFSDGKGVESGFPTPTHKQFFDPAVAASLLNNIEESVAYLGPIATSTEIPVSDELSRVFEAAEVYRPQFHYQEIEPLHLLAAVFNDESSAAVRELRGAGITQEEVFKRLRA